MMPQVILAYVPVLHQGYLNFFRRYPEAKTLYVVKEELTFEIEAFVKDIRALPAFEMQSAISGLGLFDQVKLANKADLKKLSADQSLSWIMPDEEVMHDIAKTYFPDKKIEFDTIFLRWDRKNILAQKEVGSAKSVLPADFNAVFLKQAGELKNKSADWWRQVGGILVKNGEVLLSGWNHHVPHSLEPYFNGDPRASFHKGEHIELSTAIHAESALIAEAAKKGVSVEGADLYVTTFPCPVCAKLIASAGIKTVYFSEGYAMLDGESILKESQVAIFKV